MTRNEAIIAMYDDGVNLARIGERFGITRERVRQIVKRAGRVMPRADREARISQAVAALAACPALPQYVAARNSGVAVQTLRRAMGGPLRSRFPKRAWPRSERSARAIRMMMEGASGFEVARQLGYAKGVTPYTIFRRYMGVGFKEWRANQGLSIAYPAKRGAAA